MRVSGTQHACGGLTVGLAGRPTLAVLHPVGEYTMSIRVLGCVAAITLL